MVDNRRSPALRYGVAVFSVAVVTLIRLLLEPYLGVYARLTPFVLAVMFGAWYGGLGPGLLATALSALITNFLFQPLSIHHRQARVALALFCVLGAVISSVVDALRRELEERRRAEQASRAQTQALVEVIERLAQEHDLERLQELVLAAIVNQLDAWGGGLSLYNEETDAFRVVLDCREGQVMTAEAAGHPLAGQEIASRDVPVWEELKAGYLRRECLQVPDLESDPRLPERIRAELLRMGVRSFLLVPLVLQNRLVGFYSVRNVRRKSYGPREIQLAQALALQATLAMEFTRLAQQSRHAAVLQERERAARERAAELEARVRERTAELETAKEALHRQAELMDISHDALIAWELGGGILSWNRGAEELYGWKGTEVLGKVTHDLLRSRHPISVAELEAALVRDGRWDGELLHTTRDGRQIVVESRHVFLQTEEGGRLVLEMNRDITERKRVQEAVRESEERFRQLFDSSQAVMDTVAEGLYTIDAQGLVTYVNPVAEALFGWTKAGLMGRKMHDVTHYLHPDGTPFPAEECAGLQVLQKGVVLKEHEDVFIRKDGSFFPVVFSAAPLTVDGASVGIVVSFRDDTERRLAEEALRTSEARYRQLSEELEHRVRERTAELARTVEALHAEMTEREQAERSSQAQTRALTRVLEQLTREQRFEKFPGIVLAAIVDQFEAVGGALWSYDEVTEFFERMLDAEGGRIIPADDPDSPFSQKRVDFRKIPDWERRKAAYLRGECVVVPDPLNDPTLEPSQRPAYAKLGIRTVLAVPLLLQGRLVGLYSIRSARQENYGPRDFAFAYVLGRQATLAIQMARLAEQAQETAVLEERNRMAREIHDTLAQAFTGILLQLGAAERLLADAPEQGQAHLQTAGNLAREGLAEARRSVQALRPQALEEMDLAGALARMVEQLNSDPSTRITFRLEGMPRPLPPDVADHLLRIGQEALTNALRHAQASEVGAELTFAGEELRLCVSDDGRGFARESPPRKGGFGLLGMEERASLIGAQLSVESQPGSGTRVELTWPTPAPPG